MSHKQLKLLCSVLSEWGKESKAIEIISVVKIPYTISECKKVAPKGKEGGTVQTQLISVVWTN